MGQYLPIVTLLVLAVVFGVHQRARVAAAGAAPPDRRRSPRPTSAASCPRKDPPERFPVRFYLVAMIFIVFDIEIIFLYPWAVIYRELGAFGLSRWSLFAVAVFVSFLYLISQRRPRLGPGQAAAPRRRPDDGRRPSAPSHDRP